ncbi:8-oxo-dGTP diphosphatase [Candidatus Pacearchaeota archaeon]|nr:8-oxo-dGTP diphosphatase [Candidatus Pacearchaeota archaeon]
MGIEKPSKQCTLCIIVSNNKILLGMKKRGFGVGKYNGYGGKVKVGEGVQEAALREFKEESGLEAKIEDLVKVGEIDFYFPHQPNFDQTVHIYTISNFEGMLKETEEMSPHWFNLEEIPYSSMWDDDKHWLPLVLEGKKFNGYFIFKELNGENIVNLKNIEEVDSFQRQL